MAISKPITRVEQYLAHISGMRVNVPEVPLTREEMYLASWARKSGIEDTEMQGDPPLTLKDCIGEPFNGLVLYGKSTQVTTTGAQLLDLSDLIGKTETKNGATYKINEDQSISVSGTPTEYTSFYLKAMSLKAGSYYFSSNSDNYKVFVQLIGVKLNMNNGFTLDEDTDNIGVYVVFNVVSNNTESFNMTFTSMLNAGDTALPWEPYTGGKPSPSPDYPQEIQSAGDDGSIGIEVHGKNIFGGRYYYASYANSILIINGNKKEEEVKLPYASKYENFGVCKVIKCKKGKTYVISVTNPNKNATIGMAEYENIENASAYTKNVGFARMTTKTKQLYTAKSDGILVCGIAGTWTDGKTTVHECTESELLQVEEASEATSYEPYHTPHTLTIPTPNGLPGIPVSSGGNYTDEQGQQWICDEVDMERGVKVQRVGAYKFYSSDGFTMDQAAPGLTRFYIVIGDTLSADTGTLTSSALCSALQLGAQGDTYGRINVFTIVGTRLYINIENITSVNELQQYLQQTPMTLIALLATPIETPLSETDIAAYRALTTYKGTTILESECYLKVKYSKLRK
nr:MAG TPA: hypothetical protein [Caudoviricetes sp.]